jgi:hypothetical protein
MSREILQLIVSMRDFMHKLLGCVQVFIDYLFSKYLCVLHKNFALFFMVGEGCPFHIWFGIMDHNSVKKYKILNTLWGN